MMPVSDGKGVRARQSHRRSQWSMKRPLGKHLGEECAHSHLAAVLADAPAPTRVSTPTPGEIHLQILLCLVGGIYGGVRAAGLDVKNMHFIRGPDEEPQSPALVGFLKFWSFIIIFTNFVPISLLVTLDMVKVFQSKIIGWDRQIYYEARDFDGTRRPMPAQVGVCT